MINLKSTVRIFLSCLLVFVSILVVSLFSEKTVEAANVNVTPTEQSGVLLNPGKGWVIYDTNNAVDEVHATASGTGLVTTTAALNDGNDATAVQSGNNPTFPQYLTYTWDANQTFSSTTLKCSYCQGQAPTNWDVQVSDDGTTWTTIASSGTVSWSYNNATIESKTISFSPVTHKMMRVQINSANLQSGYYTVNELKVAGYAASNITAGTQVRASVAYSRWNWIDIEPTEGIYNWDKIDSFINYYAGLGMKVAFGIMADNTCSSGQYITPKWVFDAGAASTTGWVGDCNGGRTRTTPVWNDPVFLAKYKAMLTALAARYDGSPNLAYIDVRSYGNWGEMDAADYFQGSVNISNADYQYLHLQMFLDTFSKTPIIVTTNGGSTYTAAYDWAVTQGMGARRDGIPDNSNGSEITRAYGNAPGVVEWTGSWTAYHWSTTSLAAADATAKASYENFGQWGGDAIAFLNDEQPYIDSQQNVLGYHFVLTGATLPDTITNGTVYPTSLTWNNKGLDYSYEPMRLAYALLDSSDNVVAKYFPHTGANPQRLSPGVTTETPNLVFSGVPAGTYKLAVGIFKSLTDANPTYNLAITGKTANGWYPLLNSVSVSGSGTYTDFPLTYETEFMTPTFSTGKHDVHVRDVNMSSGMGDRFNATGTGQNISYPVYVTQTGTIDVKVRVKKTASGGNFQLAIDGVNQGPVMYTYASSDSYALYDLGNVTFSTTGVHQFTFTNVGTSVWGYTLTTDYIHLSTPPNWNIMNDDLSNYTAGWSTAGTGTITQNSGNVSIVDNSTANYFYMTKNTFTPPTGAFTFEVTAKANATGTTNEFTVRSGSYQIGLYLTYGTAGTAQNSETNPTKTYTLDTTINHTYRVVVHSDYTYDLYVDGIPGWSGAASLGTGTDIFKIGGSVTSTANVIVDQVNMGTGEILP